MAVNKLLRLASTLVVAAAGLALVPSVDAAIPVTVRAHLASECLEGTGPRNSNVSVTLRTPSGSVRNRLRTSTDDTGYWVECFTPWTTPQTLVMAGDQLRVVVGGSERTIVVRNADPKIERVADIISGKVAPLAELTIAVYHGPFMAFSDTEYQFNILADDTGRFRIDTSTVVNLRGRDPVVVVAKVGPDEFVATRETPFLHFSHANNFLTGSANLGTKVNVRLLDAEGHLKGLSSGLVVYNTFTRALWTDGDAPAYPERGDELVGNWAQDARLQVPASALRGLPAEDRVIGRCMADAPYWLEIAGNETFRGRTDSRGWFVRDIGHRFNLRRGDSLVLQCMYQTGDVWHRASEV